MGSHFGSRHCLAQSLTIPRGVPLFVMGCGASIQETFSGVMGETVVKPETWGAIKKSLQDNDKDQLKAIVDKDKDMHINKANVSDKRNTVLLYACAYSESLSLAGDDSNNRRDLCSSLLEWKADVNHTNQLGFAPLHTACSAGDTALAKLLIE